MALQYTTSYANETGTMSLSIAQVSSGSLTITAENPGSVHETLISAPLDRPETWEFAVKDIDSVYKDTTVPTIARPSTSRGIQVMVKHTSYTTVTDDTNADLYKLLPMVSWSCVRVPVNEYMTADQVNDEICRMIAGFYGVAVTSDRLAQMLRGALKV